MVCILYKERETIPHLAPVRHFSLPKGVGKQRKDFGGEMLSLVFIGFRICHRPWKLVPEKSSKRSCFGGGSVGSFLPCIYSQEEAILVQKYRDRNGRSIAMHFKSMKFWVTRGRYDSPDRTSTTHPILRLRVASKVGIPVVRQRSQNRPRVEKSKRSLWGSLRGSLRIPQKESKTRLQSQIKNHIKTGEFSGSLHEVRADGVGVKFPFLQ